MPAKLGPATDCKPTDDSQHTSIGQGDNDMATIAGFAETRKVYMNGKNLEPGPSQKVWNHSPDGFNWGYGGSGPAQLALAILLKITDKETAVMNYQQFKWDYVAKWPQNKDFFVEVDIKAWLERQAEKQEDSIPI